MVPSAFSGSDLNFPALWHARSLSDLALGSQNGEASETSLAEQHPAEGVEG
jgi:hypothetical protein